MKRIQLSGTPYAVGEQHGKQGKEQVAQSLETYERLFHDYAQIDWKEAQERALVHLSAIEEYDIDLIEEMEGVAKGAGVDFEDILALNARSEIALTNNTFDGCTAIAVTMPISSKTFLGQNWDWKASQSNSLLLLDIKQKSKPDITMVTEGGIIGKIGLNSSGIGVCLNALLTNAKSDKVPIHLGMRGILNSYTLGEAISRVSDFQMASAANFLIASDEGEGKAMAVDLEVSPLGIEVMFNVDGAISHTNHLCSKNLKSKMGDLVEVVYSDSMIRSNRIEQLLHLARQGQKTINEDTFKSWFSDHFNYPDSICRHENERMPEYRRMKSVFSIIMNLSERTMRVSDGSPCCSSYEKVK
jgi:isopenicillin-N N-acyltransferase-like protein